MFTDESSDSDVPEGISWDVWKETTSEKYFGSPTISLIAPIPLDAVAMPYQKAVCYGYYPSYEVDSMQLIECKACGTVLKQVGYGHHLRTRHARAKSPFSVDECQTFLLSPPHVASPHQCEVDTPSPSYVKEPTYLTTVTEEPERVFSRTIPAQYSIEQRDDLKLALRVSRREPTQLSNATSEPTLNASVESPVNEPRKYISSGGSSKKTANGKIKSKKKKKKRRPESSSSDDFSLDHFRSKRRLGDEKQRDVLLLPSTSGIDSNTVADVQETAVNNECSIDGNKDEFTFIGDGSCKDTEERSSESPDLLLADLLNPHKKLALQGNHCSDSVRARLRSFNNDTSTNATSGVLEQTNCKEEVGSFKKSDLPPRSPSEQRFSQNLTNYPGNEMLYENNASSTSIVGDEEEPPVLKPEVYFTKPEAHSTEEEPLVVEACGSNTFVLSSKVKKKIVNNGMDVAMESPSLQPTTGYLNPTTSRDPIPDVATSSAEYFFYPSETDSDYQNCSTSTHCSLFTGDRDIIMRAADSQGYSASDSVFEKGSYATTLLPYHSDDAKGFMVDSVHNEQEQPFLQQRTYCTSTNADGTYGASDVACSSKIQNSDGMGPSVSFSVGNMSLGRDTTGTSIYTATRRRTEKENTIILRRQPVECQQRNQRSHNMRPAVTWRKGSHRVLRHPSAVTLDLSSGPRRRMIFTQRKHDEYRYANTRVAIAKILGTPVEYPEFHKRLPPLVCTEDVHFDPCHSMSEVCLASTSEGLGNGNISTSKELLNSDSYIIPLSKEPSFLLKSEESMNPTEITNSVRDVRRDFVSSKPVNEAVSVDPGDGMGEEVRHNTYISRTIHVPASAVQGTHFVGGQHVVHVLSEPHLSSSTYYSSSDSVPANALPPPLSPQQSPSGLHFSEIIPEPESSRLIASGFDATHSHDNSWDVLNYNSDTLQLSRQTSRKIIETPPVLKRMLATTMESQPLENDLSGGSLSFSGQMRCFVRQHGELSGSPDVVFPSMLDPEDNNITTISTFGNPLNEESDTLPVLPRTGVCRVGSSSVTLKPTILASGNKRYRLLPSAKAAYSGSPVYTQAPQNTIRLSATAVPYFDSRFVGRSQDAAVNGTVTTSRRVSQRSNAGVPILDKFSSTAHLSGVSNLCAVSPTSLQSSDAGCVSSLVPKTRMC